jgi:two-component system sensor histidine kinase SenX3
MAVQLTVVGVVFGLVGFAVGAWWSGRSRAVAVPVDPPPPTVVVAASPPNYDLVEAHRDGFVVADASGQVTYRNAAAKRLQGTHVGVLLDEAIDRHVRITSKVRFCRDVVEVYGPPKMAFGLESYLLDDGRVVVYIEDDSERRRTVQIRTDFVANISHELKTPVGALAVLAETLEDETDPEIIRRVVGRMQGEADRAARTIDDLMELSRIELGRERIVEPVAVADVITEAMARVGELAAQRGIGVSYLAAVGQVGGLFVPGDRRQLISALGNLVENAVKYSEPGGQVQIRVHDREDHVEFSVIDDGVGIPQRDLDRIFERFYRVDRARSRVTGGTGLGLSIVRHVASNHGGSVSVTSTEGEGSTFTLSLPATHGVQQDAAGITGGDTHEGIA